MTAVFLDTVGLLANFDESDQWHQAAAKAMRALLKRRCRLVTTSFVLLECGNAAARTTFRGDVHALRLELQSHGNLIVPTARDEEAAWTAYLKGEASRAGIVDQVSFAVMRRLGISEAFTNDRHFTAASFKVLF